MRAFGLLPFAIALLTICALATSTSAQETDQAAEMSIQLEPVPASVVGDRPVIVAHLTTTDGQPVDGVVLVLSVNGFAEDRTATVANGTAILRIAADLPAGTHEIRVVVQLSGVESNAPPSAQLDIEVMPGTIDVQIVPALEGVEARLIHLDGVGGAPQPGTSATTVVSDREGFARFPITAMGAYRVELLLPWKSQDPTIRAEFSRWHDNVFDTWRDVEYKSEVLLQAGFEVHYFVTYNFTNLQGDRVDSTKVNTLTLMNSMGERLDLTVHEPLWVQGGRVTRRSGGLEETELRYSVDQVIVDGSNVVYQSQNRFVPAESQLWTIPLLFYSMSFVSQDALFAVPVGSSVEVTSPNGTTIIASLNENGQAHLPLLPRGEYQVRVSDGGYSPPVPVALSRDQTVALKVITVWDAVFVVGLGGGAALSLLVFGRWKSAIKRMWIRLRRTRTLRPT